MTDDEFDEFLKLSCELLDEKQRSLTNEFGLGTHDQYGFDQLTGLLTFRSPAGIVEVQAEGFIIGTYVASKQSWRWAWANETIVAGQRQKASRLQMLRQVTGMVIFERPDVEADTRMAGELVAMAVQHLSLRGAYRAKKGSAETYLGIESISRIG